LFDIYIINAYNVSSEKSKGRYNFEYLDGLIPLNKGADGGALD
jgi:hypothetical protein